MEDGPPCQPHVQEGYVPLTDPARREPILAEASLDLGRLKWWPVENVLHTQVTEAVEAHAERVLEAPARNR